MPQSNRSHRPLKGKDTEIMMLKQVTKMSNVEIGERLGVTEGAIRYRLKRIQAKAIDRRTQRPSGVSAYDGVIAQWVRDYEEESHRPAIKTLHERLVKYYGYTLSYDAMRRYVKKKYPGFFGKRVRTRIETPPGVLALVDWKENVPVQMGSPEHWVLLNCFVYALGFSRKTVAVWCEDRRLEHWIHSHEEAFRRLGGLPSVIRPDCLKDAVTTWKGQNSGITPGYKKYLEALDITVFPARPGEASDKGKVEKKIRDIFGRLDFHNRVFTDMRDLQLETDRVIGDLEATWRCGATGLQVPESFAYEKEYLRPLPTHFPTYPVEERRCLVRHDKTVFFKGNWYQMEKSYVGKRVLCIFTGQEIVVKHEGREIGRFEYLPEAKGMVRLQEQVLEDPHLHLSETVRGWAMQVARRQVDYYHEIIMRRQS